jgi:hypothetical protein
MLWLKEHKRNWRVAFLIMLVIVMSGPWFFDRVWVPQPYICSSPNVRLDDVFCGVPISITWLLAGVPSQFTYLVNGLITGSTANYAATEWLFILFSIFLMFPFISTPILILWQEQRYWSAIHRVALGLAAGTSLLIGTLDFSVASWMLWGVWFYVFLTAGLLVVEIVAAPKTIDISAEKL